MNKYYGLTYPLFLCWWPFRQLWKRFLCSKNMHLFDEAASGGPFKNYLNCDACGLVVMISQIFTEEESCEICAKYESGKLVEFK